MSSSFPITVKSEFQFVSDKHGSYQKLEIDFVLMRCITFKWTDISSKGHLYDFTLQDYHWMGKGPQLSALQPGQDGGHTICGSESESGLPVPVLSPGRLWTSRHHHRHQVSGWTLWSSLFSKPTQPLTKRWVWMWLSIAEITISHDVAFSQNYIKITLLYYCTYILHACILCSVLNHVFYIQMYIIVFQLFDKYS